MPYTGTFPASGTGITNGSATYEAADGFHGFAGSTYVNTDVSLTADFGDKTIMGTIGDAVVGTDADNGPDGLTAAASDVLQIDLKQTGIGASMSGSATIVGTGGETTSDAKLAPVPGARGRPGSSAPLRERPRASRARSA